MAADKLKSDRDLVTQAIAAVGAAFGASATPGGVNPPLVFPSGPANPNPGPTTFPSTEDDTSAPLVTTPSDPNFIGPLLPKMSPTPGSPGDYGQNTVYWPNDGNPTHVDELGNPLPYGVTRSLGNGTTLTPATTGALDLVLKEDLPTIEQAFHEW